MFGGGGVVVKYNARESPIHATTWEAIHYLLTDRYKANDDKLPDPDNKPIPTGDAYRPVNKYVCKWSDIDHRRSAVC